MNKLLMIILRLKVLLWIPFMIFYFPMLIVLGKDMTDDIGLWIHDIE